MEEFQLIDLLQKYLGWTITILVLFVIFIVSIFAKGIAGALGKYLQDSLLHGKIFSIRKIDITRHPIFAKYHFLINQRLKYINCHCVLRKKIFCDLMIIRIEVYNKIVKEFAQRDDINQISIIEFQYAMRELMFQTLSVWKEKAKLEGIPQVVIDRFIESTEEIRESFFLFVQSVSNSTYSYVDNISRTSAVFDMLSAFEEALLIKLEESLDDLNGEISGSTYKGIVCQNCPTCQSKHRRNDNVK